MKKSLLFLICFAVFFSIQAYGGGSENGFTVEGRLARGQETIPALEVYLIKGDSFRKDVTDGNGFFKITGLDKGSYNFDVIYRSPQVDSNSAQNGPGVVAVYNQQIDIDSDRKMEIDLDSCSVSGKVPEEFTGDKKTFINASKWETVGIPMPNPREWTHMWMLSNADNPDANGNFEIKLSRPGKYYLALYKNGGVQTVTEVFDISGSQTIENMTFKKPDSSLKVIVVSAESKEPLDNALCVLANRQNAHYFRTIAESGRPDLITDTNGIMEYDNLPADIYDFTTMQKGYLLKKTKGIKIGVGDNVAIEAALDKSAVVDFALADELKEQTTEPLVFLLCKVTDLDSNQVYMFEGMPGEMQKQVVFFKMPKEHQAIGGATVDSALDLPTGRYGIEYELFQGQSSWTEAFGKEPLLTGQAEVNAKAGEITQIIIEKK